MGRGLYRSRHEFIGVFKAPGATHRNNVELGKYGRNRTNVWEYTCAATFSKASEEGASTSCIRPFKPVRLGWSKGGQRMVRQHAALPPQQQTTGCIIIVMQRLHQDDLIGQVLLQDDWTVLSFPAIAEEPECVPFWTPYGTRRFIRRPDEALHPDREAVAEYGAMRRRIGLYKFSSQYQQRPIPISGNLVKREWLRSYGPDDVPRRFMRIIQSWDTAAKTSELNDYSVCTTWASSERVIT